MHYNLITEPKTVAAYLEVAITTHLAANKRVLWFVPGGSSIPIAAAASRLLAAGTVPLTNLTVTLTDERYGSVNHPDSNWLQLEQAGFTLPGATLLPLLVGTKNMAEVTTAYGELIKGLLDAAEYRLGFFGIGADGHVAGCLPGSPAVQSKEYAVSYDAGAFKRITMTPTAIARLDEAAVYAVGDTKHAVLDSLETELPLDTQPAQILKQVPKLTIFNDYRGDKK